MITGRRLLALVLLSGPCRQGKVIALSQKRQASAGYMYLYSVHDAHMCGPTSVDTPHDRSG